MLVHTAPLAVYSELRHCFSKVPSVYSNSFNACLENNHFHLSPMKSLLGGLTAPLASLDQLLGILLSWVLLILNYPCSQTMYKQHSQISDTESSGPCLTNREMKAKNTPLALLCSSNQAEESCQIDHTIDIPRGPLHPEATATGGVMKWLPCLSGGTEGQVGLFAFHLAEIIGQLKDPFVGNSSLTSCTNLRSLSFSSSLFSCLQDQKSTWEAH